MVPEGSDLETLEEKAFERAKALAALVALCRLAIGTIPVSCGLARDVNHNFYDSLRFDNPGWNLDFEQRGRVAFVHPGQPITRAELTANLNDADFVELANAVLKRGSLPGSMNVKLTSALIRLASGLWANEPESMLLGAFTCTEMLLGSEGHDRLKARITTLLGNEIANRLELIDVSQGRHDYVHRGEPVEDKLGLTAVAFAFATLLSYSKLVSSIA